MSRNRQARRDAQRRRDPRTQTDVHAELDAVYAQVPDVGCKGLCVTACGSMGQTAAEQKRIADRGRLLPLVGHWPDGHCPALANDRCSVYEVRPTVCRLWGAVDAPGMRCPHGCVPAEGVALLTHEQGRRLLDRVKLISERASRR